MQIKKKKDAIFTPKHPKMKNIEDQTINSNFSTSNVTSGDIKPSGFDSIFQEFVSDLNENQKNIFRFYYSRAKRCISVYWYIKMGIHIYVDIGFDKFYICNKKYIFSKSEKGLDVAVSYFFYPYWTESNYSNS